MSDSIPMVDLKLIAMQAGTFGFHQAHDMVIRAMDGMHDDLMMNLVMFGWFAATPMFAESIDGSMREYIYAQQMKEIEDDVLPFGFNDDGREEIEKTHVDNEGQVWKEFNFPPEPHER